MITDRTQKDVDAARKIRAEKVQKFIELTEADINTLERGFITTNTLNRIENKQSELKEILHEAGYSVNIINRTWQYNDFFNNSELNRLIENDKILRKNFELFPDMPSIPQPKYSYNNINALEKILVVTQEAFEAQEAAYIYCGTHYTGQEGIL